MPYSNIQVMPHNHDSLYLHQNDVQLLLQWLWNNDEKHCDGLIVPLQLSPPVFFSHNNNVMLLSAVGIKWKFLYIWTSHYKNFLQTGKGKAFLHMLFRSGRCCNLKISSCTDGFLPTFLPALPKISKHKISFTG